MEVGRQDSFPTYKYFNIALMQNDNIRRDEE